ncbi:C40 family peptidase [Actinoplanes sp. HUAS TT8]|uniref:C40 family peptidase n=1 Tax=Actinoplanes sp. HUAS TT8 TaxID=3447453 RepID=UPI003F51D2FF
MHEHSSGRHRAVRNRRLTGATTAALSLGLCLCAGQLLASAPALAATTTTPVISTTAAKAAAKVKPTLTTRVSVRTIAWGNSTRITAKAVDPRTGKAAKGTIRLQAYVNGKWVLYAKKTVPSSGTVTFSTSPKTTIWLRTLFTGAGYTSTSHQAKITVKTSGAKVLAEAKKHTGALYKFAAAGPSRFDCSGFTQYVYKKAAGKKLPHKADGQQDYGKAVSKSSKKVGDLIIFRSGSYGYHAGIYAGGGYMYDSPHTGARVGKHKIYGSNYVVRRLTA